MITAESETWSPAKWREIDRATRAEEEARQARARRGLPPLPVTPTHTVRCGSRDCRPGEGNLKHAMDKHGKFKQWEQPYEHREGFVQSRLRSPPHRPRPNVEYAGLVALAARLAPRGGPVLLAAADWDYRELALNWYLHARRLGYRGALVLSMERALHELLLRRGVPSFDGGALLAAWNRTCLQRHIQAVRMERH
ncbi:hypothetical protein EMIHUDRAFT_453936, partial [Emiliania huxleyi CCMP1516]|uniref:NYN domain-containing protein n=2 Tax=Emiliania huxleyi TaxID=2903 RepID=A0A0D3HZ16_EMIH1